MAELMPAEDSRLETSAAATDRAGPWTVSARVATRLGVALATTMLVTLLRGSPAGAAAPESFPRSGPHRGCPFVTVPEIYPGYPPGGVGPQEIDEFGRGLPSCQFADRLLRTAPTRIPEKQWGKLAGWRCVWIVSWEECKRNQTRVYASNPGD